MMKRLMNVFWINSPPYNKSIDRFIVYICISQLNHHHHQHNRELAKYEFKF